MLAAIERKYLHRSHRVGSKTVPVGRDRVGGNLSYALYLYCRCTCIVVRQGCWRESSVLLLKTGSSTRVDIHADQPSSDGMGSLV